MSAKPLPTVVLEPVFVRDQQRRLRLVMDLLEQELRQPQTPLDQHHEQNTKTEVQWQATMGRRLSRQPVAESDLHRHLLLQQTQASAGPTQEHAGD